MKTKLLRAALPALFAAGLLSACSSTEPVGEYSQRSIEGYTKAGDRTETTIIRRDTATIPGRSMPIDPYATGTTYRDRTLYGRP